MTGDDVADDSSNSDQITLSEQIDDIISEELDSTPTTSDEHDARKSTSVQLLKSIHPGLFAKIQSCTDRLVMLSAQLIGNETSNLAECPSVAIMMEGNSLTASSLELLRPDVMLQDYVVRMVPRGF